MWLKFSKNRFQKNLYTAATGAAWLSGYVVQPLKSEKRRSQDRPAYGIIVHHGSRTTRFLYKLSPVRFNGFFPFQEAKTVTVPRTTDDHDAWVLFRDFLRRRGERVTQPRRIVLRQAMVCKDHFRADQLAAALAKGRRPVSRGTVYRTLALLVEAGLLREIRDGDVHVHYEIAFGREHHEHMICDQCGTFIEFSDADIAEKLDHACRKHNFRQRTHRIAIFGLCEDCAIKKELGISD
jgi:Fur family ferric uptake transcriptional regulator